jgi:hypothetical protein
MNMGSYTYIAMFLVISSLFLLVEIEFKHPIENINTPNIKSFEIFLIEVILVLSAIVVIVKGLLRRPDLLVNNRLVLVMLKSKIVIYFLMICISTLVFFIIGWGIPTNQLWDREFLINTIILCLIIFIIYELIIKTILSLRGQ